MSDERDGRADEAWQELLVAAQDARERRLQRICLSLDIDALVGALIVDLIERIEELESGRRRE